MLRHTFCHLSGIGEKVERRLWEAGVTSWEEALRRGRDLPAGARQAVAELRASLGYYSERNPAWFHERLPAAQAWRLYHDFQDSCAFLDIETTGMLGWGHVTTVALYDGRSIRHYIHGQNLHEFVRDVAAYRLLVTYNGKAFDVPFLERTFGVRLSQAHIDLRYVLHSLGFKGGLKSCERQLGMSRPGLEDVDGYVAVLLWHEYRRRQDPRALQTLLAYNIQDTVNLESLMVLAHNRKLAGLAGVSFAPSYHLPMPPAPANPFAADAALVQRLLREFPPPRPGWGR
jgi:uncharacterized protein YprB with RNaseH-like and TPR domain